MTRAWRRLRVLWVAPLAVGLLCSFAPVEAVELESILVEFDKVQDSFQTLRAEFDETTRQPMLKDPVVAKGRFYMTKPDSIRWEYSAPEEMRFVISRDEYTGFYPNRKRAERKNIKRWSEQIFRFFGLGQGSAELQKFYRIELVEEDVELGAYVLLLEPKKRRARKRVESVQFWLDSRTYLPQKVEYGSKDGSTRTVTFSDIVLDPDISAGLYQVDIPADFTVTHGFGGMPSLSPGSSQ